MTQAIPTVEWCNQFKWDSNLKCNENYWLPEEECGINLVLHFGVINGLLKKTEHVKRKFKIFIQSTHDFINYNKSIHFDGFDWFLATVFLICSGNLDKLVLSFIIIKHLVNLNSCKLFKDI
jgi:hypothetical protein